MKLISADEIKQTVKDKKPSVYYIPNGRILSPAAKDYLNRCLIQVDTEKNRPTKCENKHGYRDYITGDYYDKKPEYMTHIYGNQLVRKDAAIIRYRGKLDRLQAEIITAQTVVYKESRCEGLINELGELLTVSREIMRCELMQNEIKIETIIGLTRDELREHSHHSDKYYHVNVMELPDMTKGQGYAWLNLIRTSVRETELAAVEAFLQDGINQRTDIIEILNRMSSAVHIMMCKWSGGFYKDKEKALGDE